MWRPEVETRHLPQSLVISFLKTGSAIEPGTYQLHSSGGLARSRGLAVSPVSFPELGVETAPVLSFCLSVLFFETEFLSVAPAALELALYREPLSTGLSTLSGFRTGLVQVKTDLGMGSEG